MAKIVIELEGKPEHLYAVKFGMVTKMFQYQTEGMIGEFSVALELDDNSPVESKKRKLRKLSMDELEEKYGKCDKY